MIEIDNPLADFAAAELERITGPLRREFERIQSEAMKPFTDYVARMLDTEPVRLTAVK